MSVASTLFFGPEIDDEETQRLGKQLGHVLTLMSDGRPRTLREISMWVNAGEASISARLRDLRRLGYVVTRTKIGRGLFAYRVLPRGTCS